MKNHDFSTRHAGVVLLWVMAPAAAMAYIDPGNGAYMVQALFAVLGAALFYLRHPIQSMKSVGRWLAAKLSGSTKRAFDDTVAPEVPARSVTKEVHRP